MCRPVPVLLRIVQAETFITAEGRARKPPPRQIDGGIHVFLNAGSDMAPVFGGSTPVMVGEPGAKAAINLGARATIAVTDWNEDGRVDLVAGALDGQVRVYLNQAASGAPDFRAALLVNDGGVALDDASGRSSVAVIDLNGDGRQDLVLGNTAGEMRCFANVGTNAAPAFDGVVAIPAGGTAIDLAGTPRSRPFVGDFNADGLVTPCDCLLVINELHAGMGEGEANADLS